MTQNKTEERYSERLRLMQRAGEVKSWGYETMRLRLADQTFYTPEKAI